MHVQYLQRGARGVLGKCKKFASFQMGATPTTTRHHQITESVLRHLRPDIHSGSQSLDRGDL